MENSEPLALWDDDALESYLVCRKQAIDVHLTLGTQRLLELIEGQRGEGLGKMTITRCQGRL
jgi:hypothetical protein